MDKKLVFWGLGCLCILLAPRHGITVAAEAACVAALFILAKAYKEVKLLDCVAALLLQQVLIVGNSIWAPHVLSMEGQAESLPGMAGKALWLIGLVASYLVCVAACAWLREKMGQGKERNLMLDRCKYIAAFLVMLLGLASDGGAVASSLVFLLLITDGQYYRTEGYQMKRLILPLAAAVILIVAWMAAVDYLELSLWQIGNLSEKLRNEMTVASSVGLAYVLLLFFDTFQSKGQPSRIG